MASDQQGVIAEPYGIRWGVIDQAYYPVARKREDHDLAALLAEEPLDEVPAANIVVPSESAAPQAAPAMPPPLPPPKR